MTVKLEGISRISDMPTKLRFTLQVGNAVLLIGSDNKDTMTTTAVWTPE